MKLCISGTRLMPESKDYQVWTQCRVVEGLKALGHSSFSFIELAVGNGKGVDKNVLKAIAPICMSHKVFEADWQTHGKKAGPIRNRQMAEYADALIALPAKSGSKGTMNTVDEFLKLKKPVVVLWQDF